MASKLLATFLEKENAIALTSELKKQVRHIWVMVMKPTPSYNFYQVEVQNDNASPCSKEQFEECLAVKNSFQLPILETEPIPEKPTYNKVKKEKTSEVNV